MAITCIVFAPSGLYFGPSTTNYPIDTVLAANTGLTILQQEGSWYYVETMVSPKEEITFRHPT